MEPAFPRPKARAKDQALWVFPCGQGSRFGLQHSAGLLLQVAGMSNVEILWKCTETWGEIIFDNYIYTDTYYMCIKEAGSWFGKIERDSPYWVNWIDLVDLQQKRITEMTWHEIRHNDSSSFSWEKNLLSSRELTYATWRKLETHLQEGLLNGRGYVIVPKRVTHGFNLQTIGVIMEVTGAIPWVPTVPRLSSGAGEQILTRQMFRLGQLLHLPKAFLGEVWRNKLCMSLYTFSIDVTGTDYECHSHGLLVECWWIFISMVILIVIVVKCGKMGSQNQTDTVHHAQQFFRCFHWEVFESWKASFSP